MPLGTAPAAKRATTLVLHFKQLNIWPVFRRFHAVTSYFMTTIEVFGLGQVPNQLGKLTTDAP